MSVYTSLINSSFILTVDHLPADIVRLLWLLQSINIAIEKHQAKLQKLAENDRKQILAIKTAIQHLSDEGVLEARALLNQLVAHKLTLSDEINQLVQMQAKLNNSNQSRHSNKELRDKLRSHYERHPLQSQQEALEEQKERRKEQPIKVKIKPFQPMKTGRGRPRLEAPKKIKKPVIQPVVEPVVEPGDIQLPLFDQEPEKYCFCGQGSFGDMIACDNEGHCPNGEWFHYKCVGLLNRVEAMKYTVGTARWYCSEGCREQAQARAQARAKRKKRRW